MVHDLSTSSLRVFLLLIGVSNKTIIIVIIVVLEYFRLKIKTTI